MTTPLLPGLDIEPVRFFVPGAAAPQGSKSFRGMRGGHAIMTESSKAVGPWRERVALAAHAAMLAAGQELITEAVTVDLLFILPRAKSAPKRTTPLPAKRPDTDKLSRACLDAITDVIIKDDAQVVDLFARKRTAHLDGARSRPGVYVTVRLGVDDDELDTQRLRAENADLAEALPPLSSADRMHHAWTLDRRLIGTLRHKIARIKKLADSYGDSVSGTVPVLELREALNAEEGQGDG